MEVKVVQLGEHMPMSTRRVVRFCGEPAQYKTAVGCIEGLADGAVVFRDFGKDLHVELTPEQAKEIGKAFTHSACAVEQWQEHASGFNRIRVARVNGAVTVTHRGRTRPMRLSKLKGSKRTGRFWRRCDGCGAHPPTIWVAADDLRKNGSRVQCVEVCQACVDRLANALEPRAALIRMDVP